MKKPSAVVGLLLVAAQILLPAPSPGCGIAVSIWGSIENAEVVALVLIESLEVEELTAGSRWDSWSFPRKRLAARLRVLETWKGNPPGSIEVDLGEDYESGRTPWKVGGVLVAFLERGTENASARRKSQAHIYEILATMIDEQQEVMEADPGSPQTRVELDAFRRDSETAYDLYDKWMAQRWSLADVLVRDDEDQDRDAWAKLIRFAVKLQTDGSDVAESLDWHVTAAERRATRYQGLLELSYMVLPQRVDPPEIYVSEDGTDEATPGESPWSAEEEPPAQLTLEQLRRLAEGFAREQSADHSDITMLRLLASYPDVEVDRAAAASIEAGLLLRPIPEWVTPMMEEALKRYGDRFADRIGRDDRDPRGRPIYSGPGENTLGTIWAIARRDLGIPEVPPAEIRAPDAELQDR